MDHICICHQRRASASEEDKMTQTTRRSFIKAGSAATMGIAAASVPAPAIAQSMPEIKWRQTTSWPKSLDTLYGGA
jgi:TRAP-type mannitol/chloroaromatic compound transport system substrate-binding protein